MMHGMLAFSRSSKRRSSNDGESRATKVTGDCDKSSGIFSHGLRRHLCHKYMERKVGFRVLTGQGANIDTTTASGRLVFGIFAALAEFERELRPVRVGAKVVRLRPVHKGHAGRSYQLEAL